MRMIIAVVALLAGLFFCGCTFSGAVTDEIDLSEGITITVTDDGDVLIESLAVTVDEVLSKLESMKVDRSDIILIKVSPRASQRPVMDILDQLGNAKYRNISLSSDK